MKLFRRAERLPTRAFFLSIKRADYKSRLTFALRDPIKEAARDLKNKDNDVSSKASLKLAKIAKEGSFNDASRALRILAKEARGRSLVAYESLNQEVGREATSESIRATAKANNTFIFSMGSIICSVGALSIYTRSVPLVALSLAALCFSTLFTIAHSQSQGPFFNSLKMTHSSAQRILIKQRNKSPQEDSNL
jgi:hypothetical protein